MRFSRRQLVDLEGSKWIDVDFRWLGLLSIGLSVLTLLLTLILVPLLWSWLGDARGNTLLAGQTFKVRSNAVWAQIQQLKRNVTRRSALRSEVYPAVALPPGFIPFPFQRFRSIPRPPAIAPLRLQSTRFAEGPEVEDVSSPEGLGRFIDEIDRNDPVEEETDIEVDEIVTVAPLRPTTKASTPTDHFGKGKNRMVEVKAALDHEHLSGAGLQSAYVLAEMEERERQGEFPATSTTTAPALESAYDFQPDTGPKEIFSEQHATLVTGLYEHEIADKCRGPPGQSGLNGFDGFDGESGLDGLPGADGNEVMDSLEPECETLPAGPPGIPGLAGVQGPPGGKGFPGPTGAAGTEGLPGTPGAVGDVGVPGKPGRRGPTGLVGADVMVGVGVPGVPGPPGSPGPVGPPGENGQQPQPAYGPSGPPGIAGERGDEGFAGPPGELGEVGMPGPDAQYCPCPRPTPVVFGPAFGIARSRHWNARLAQFTH